MDFHGKTRGGRTHAGHSETRLKRTGSYLVFCGAAIHDGWSEGLPDPSTPDLCGNCSRVMKKRAAQASRQDARSKGVISQHHTVPVGKRRRLRGADPIGSVS